jgi:hypothetical protein
MLFVLSSGFLEKLHLPGLCSGGLRAGGPPKHRRTVGSQQSGGSSKNIYRKKKEVGKYFFLWGKFIAKIYIY